MSNKPDYKDNDPKGWCGDPKRGAAMGRSPIRDVDPAEPIKLYLRRVYLDGGGYDTNGTYFGHGDPIYWYANEEGTLDGTLRARSRGAAKTTVLEDYPKATFFN